MSGVYDFSGGFNSINSAINGIDSTLRDRSRHREIAGIGQQVSQGDFKGAAEKLFSLGDLSTGVKLLDMGRSIEEQRAAGSAFNSLMQPQQQQAAPVNLGSPNEIEDRFMKGVRDNGITNPLGQAVVAAYGRAESGFAPGNVNRSWNDPSQSGAAGTSGGIMSWRNDRLDRMYKFAESRGEQRGSISPETQAAFLVAENPQLREQLNNARTPEEANRIMANAWRFAGYNQAGGENARRLALTQQYAQRFGSNQDRADIPAQGATPVQFNPAANQGRIGQLQRVLSMPGITDSQRQAVKAELDQLIKTSDPLYQARLAQATSEAGSPSAVRALQWRAQEAGLQPGTDEYRQFIATGGRSPDEGAASQKIARLTENILATGTTADPQAARNIAVGIADGRLRASRHPTTGELLVVDMATGRPVSAGQGQAQIVAQEDGAQPMQMQQAPSQSVPSAGSDSFGRQFPAAAQSFGIEGTLARGANIVTDAIGSPPAFPEVQNTQADFAVLQESLLNDISQSYGRQPPSWLLKRIDTLTPHAGTPLEGVSGAKSKLKALGRSFEGERRAVGRALERDLTPQNRQELEARRAGLDQAIERVNGAISSFDGEQKPGSGAGGLSDGTIIVDDSGNRLILRGNKWEPIN